MNSIRGEGATAAPERPAVDFGEPYVGVQAFTEQHALFFAGRDAAMEDLRQRVRTLPFIALTGPAGSGKSSLVHAGLFPTLRQDKEVAWETLRDAARRERDRERRGARGIDNKRKPRRPPSSLSKAPCPRRPPSFSMRSAGATRVRVGCCLWTARKSLFAAGRDPKRSTLFVQLLDALARDAGKRLCVLAAWRDDALGAIETAHPIFADLIRNNRSS